MEWIKVEDMLPEFGKDVIVFSDRKDYKIYNVDTLKEITQNESGIIVDFWNTSDVIYWMELPEPPKQ